MREPVRHPITNIEAKSFTILIILGIYSGFTKPWPLLLCYVERIITWGKLRIIFQLLSSDGRHTGLPERSCGRIYADMGTQWPAHTIFIFRSNFRSRQGEQKTEDNPPTAAWQRLAASEANICTYFLPDILQETEAARPVSGPECSADYDSH